MTTPVTTYLPDDARTLNRRTLLLQAAAAGLAASALAALPFPGARVAGAADSLSASLDAVLRRRSSAGCPASRSPWNAPGNRSSRGRPGSPASSGRPRSTAADRFRIYSITKTFTAIVVLQLVDEGVLSLDDTVARWLDDPAVARIPNIDRVTLRQLLTHTSGIYDYADDTDSPFCADAFLGPNADWTKVWTPPELLAYADGANHAPYFAPGQGATTPTPATSCSA